MSKAEPSQEIFMTYPHSLPAPPLGGRPGTGERAFKPDAASTKKRGAGTPRFRISSLVPRNHFFALTAPRPRNSRTDPFCLPKGESDVDS